MSKKKTKTVEFNRKIKQAKEAGRRQAILEMLKLIPISQQAIDYTDAGMDVTIECKISTKQLLEIVRK